MSRPQLNIKFDGEGEKDLLDQVKARANQERLTLKEFVIDALKLRLAAQVSTQATQARPSVTKTEFEALKKKVLDQAISTSIEFKKDRQQIAVLAEIIASMQARLDEIAPMPHAPAVDDEDIPENF